MKKKKIMILGAGVFQVPAIKKINELGYESIALSHYKDDPGMSVAVKSYLCSTRNKVAVLKIAERESIDAIITIASEISVPVVAYVANRLGLPGLDNSIAETIYHKYLLKNFLKSHNINAPLFKVAYNITESKDYLSHFNSSIIIKPAQSAGSRGIFKISRKTDTENCLMQSFEASFDEKVVILEEFIEGDNVSGELLVVNGRIIFLELTNKLVNEFFVPYLHVLSGNIVNKTYESVYTLLSKTVKALDIKNCAMNFDVILSDKGPVLIDLGARPGGNCLPELMYYHTGVDTVKEAIKIALGQSVEVNPNKEKLPVAAYIIGSRKKGKIADLKWFNKEISEHKSILIEQYFNCKVGQMAYQFNESGKLLGYIIVKSSSSDELLSVTNKIKCIDWVQVDENSA